MRTTYRAIFAEDDGWIVGWVTELPGAIAQERTIEAARDSLKEAIQRIIETRSATVAAREETDRC